MKTYLVARREELKKRQNKGFTLMEMLIVVAIIAVLIAIAIPVFTSQLENSREATDASNIRSAVAECSACAMTGTSDSDAGVAVDTDGTATKTVNLGQDTDGWANEEVKAAKVGSKTLSDWGTPKKGGTCAISVTKNGAITLTFSS